MGSVLVALSLIVALFFGVVAFVVVSVLWILPVFFAKAREKSSFLLFVVCVVVHFLSF